MGATAKNRDHMSSISFAEAAAASDIPPVHNWRNDAQPMQLANVQQYIDVAQTLKPQSMELVASLLIKAGFAKPSDHDALIDRLMSLPEKTNLQLDGIAVSWRLKTPVSATDKLMDSSVNQDPAQIGDYFGVKLIPDTISGIVNIREAVLETSMTSRKCEFSVPSDEGYRSHKSHHLVEAGVLSHKMEVLVSHADMEAINDLTHKLKEVERSMAGASLAVAGAFVLSDKTRHSLSTRMSRVGIDTNAIRTAINDMVAFETGIDDLALSEHRRGRPDCSSLRVTNAATKRVLGNMSGSYAEQLEGILGNVVPVSQWAARLNAANHTPR